MTPIKVNESNFIYRGPTAEVADLPCRTEGNDRFGDTFSVREFTDAERQAIAMGANLRLGIYGMRPIPPVSLQVVDNQGPWQRVPNPCLICGQEVDAAVHQSGPDTHAFRV